MLRQQKKPFMTIFHVSIATSDVFLETKICRNNVPIQVQRLEAAVEPGGASVPAYQVGRADVQFEDTRQESSP